MKTFYVPTFIVFPLLLIFFGHFIVSGENPWDTKLPNHTFKTTKQKKERRRGGKQGGRGRICAQLAVP